MGHGRGFSGSVGRLAEVGIATRQVCFALRVSLYADGFHYTPEVGFATFRYTLHAYSDMVSGMGRPSSPLCPRCQKEDKAPGRSYCRACLAEKAREARGGQAAPAPAPPPQAVPPPAPPVPLVDPPTRPVQASVPLRSHPKLSTLLKSRKPEHGVRNPLKGIPEHGARCQCIQCRLSRGAVEGAVMSPRCPVHKRLGCRECL